MKRKHTLGLPQACCSPARTQANAVVKGEVRCAVPLSAMKGADPSLRIFSRALFIMDYKDSDLFHLLEVCDESCCRDMAHRRHQGCGLP
jgi:hypothetical protein